MTNIIQPLPLSTFNDPLQLVGEVHVVLLDEYGKLKSEAFVKNLVVNTGKAHVASLMRLASSVTEMQWMAIGTGVTAAAATDTDLQAEITTGLATRVSVVRTNPTTQSILYAATWTPGQATNGAITEAGTFNSATLGPASGVMLNRAVFSAQSKAAGDTLNINWTISLP